MASCPNVLPATVNMIHQGSSAGAAMPCPSINSSEAAGCNSGHRTMHCGRWRIVQHSLAGLVIVFLLHGIANAQQISAEQSKFFESKIRPVLIRECYSCHSQQAGQQKGGLRLDTKVRMETGGDSGPAIVPGNLHESWLWNAINYEDYRMPPDKPLPDQVIADFRDWIEMGAPDPRQSEIEAVQSTVTAADIKQGRKFWSFTKPKRSVIPEVTDSEWTRNPVDNFISRKHQDKNLTPADDADPNSLLRRLSFDLIGLPPDSQQLSRFLEDWASDPDRAVETAANEMLARPQFGERWGRHWLDVVRYAESSGFEVNTTFPNAWRYRDYVIDSFNGDKPYDEFIREQIAGDLLPAKTDEEWAEQLIATGFLAIGPKSLTERNARQFKLDMVDDQIDATTRVVLGVSGACARCHDHKFDPIQQQDYYAIAGIFESMSTHYGTINSATNRRPSNQLILPISDPNPFDEPLSKQMLAELHSQLAEKKQVMQDLQRARRERRQSDNSGRDLQRNFASLARTTVQIASIEAKINSVDHSGSPVSFCIGVQESDRPTNARLLVRGEFDQPAEVIERGFVQVLSRRPARIKPDSSGRRQLAEWMTDRNNPLTARVMVNRIWQHVFGTGIVQTPEDFGASGHRPTHPELLDYLAVEFMANDWSVKQLVRHLVTSRTYRMSTAYDSQNYEKDPENLFLWRADSQQLDAESLRDAMLFVSGQIELERPRASMVARAGSTVVRDGRLPSFQANGSNGSMSMMDRQRPSRGMDRGRNVKVYDIDTMNSYRSIYLPIVRDNLPQALEVFDFAEPAMIVGVRETSNTPAQGLYLLNNEFVMSQCDRMAARLMTEAEDTDDRIRLAFRLAYGRDAKPEEFAAAEKFYEDYEVSDNFRQRRKSVEQKKLASLSQAILVSAEFRHTN